MSNVQHTRATARRLVSLALIAQLAMATPLHAASVALATAPLVNSTTTTILPNLMFIMDNSGSMGQDYTPDWMMEYNMRNAPWTYNGEWNNPSTLEKNCRDSADDDGSINTALSSMDMCVVGDVPFMTSAINSQYYNPEIRYLPGSRADGSPFPSQSDPTLVLLDGYNKHNQTQLGAAGTGTPPTINLTTEYPDRVWCTVNNPTAAQISGATATSAICRTNSDYLYPDATYQYGRDNDGTTANKNVLGKYGAPYYYSVVVTEYCKETELRDCVSSSTPTGEYIFPAKARWCSDTALTTCQSVKTSTYNKPRYPGASTTAVAASNGRFRVHNNVPRTITSVTFTHISGSPTVEILGAPVTGTSRANLAAQVAAQITSYSSNPEFTATVCSTDYVCLTSTAAAGANGNGTFNVYRAPSTSGASNYTNSSNGVTGTSAPAYTFARTDIIAPVAPDVGSYPKATSRTDCAGTTCTYAEEITNFGNWYAYYRTRMQAMKSAVSNAFKPIGSNYRVGFINICKGDYVPVGGFDNTSIAIPAVAASGSITLNNRSAALGTFGRCVSSIKVGTVEILNANICGAAGISSATLASSIAAQITAYTSVPEFTAVAAGDVITITSTPAYGATANGIVSYAHAGSAVAGKVNTTGGVTGVGQKNYWYDKLFAQTASGCGTPLRSALATVGRIYGAKEFSTAGSTSGTTIDPVQYSCQKNFALLTTDGYWNSNTAAQIMDLAGSPIGNLDGTGTSRPMYEGPTASSGTLADVAKYYYDTDLRTAALGNCTGSLGIGVCEETVSPPTFTTQRMVTYTLGLGVDGTLSFVSDYNSAPSGDFYNLKNGLASTNWPVPVENSETAVDDLWHAAVNGGGTYFSAKDPAQLSYGLNAALAAIDATVGAASAAATSTLNPVAGNNFAYVASYTTSKWKGNLEARTINVDNGIVSETASWCVESIPQSGSCATPLVADSSGSGVVYNCETTVADAAACAAPGVFDSVTSKCKVEVVNSCIGTMPSKVSTLADTRTIYTSNGAGALVSFEYANLNAADFTATGLSQWPLLSASQKTAAAGENLVKYLRGQTGYEDRGSNPTDNRLYRFREATLGDALESQPFFISKPVFSYADPGYAAYKTAQASRTGMVFIGANDGMLHAFYAKDEVDLTLPDTCDLTGTTYCGGEEAWAYVPSVVIPNMWRLADKNYSSQHRNYVNGSPVISDICTANCNDAATATWKTILVGGLNAGGRSYYALDITDPVTPTLLWEISSSTTGFSNLGFSYGKPIITKKADGTWVVLVTSGYNNTSPGDGHGYLFVLDAVTGAKISEYDTDVGDTTTPSGLAKVSAWNDYQGIDNTAGYVYGGDLLGNLWRFDINSAASTSNPLLFATLQDSLSNPQPVTTAPTLGEINSQRVIFVGTGKYLETSDLIDTSRQTIYAIKDNNATTTLTNARSELVEQTMSMPTPDATARTGSNSTVDFSTASPVRGWYVDLAASIVSPPTAATFVGERVNIDMQLVQGTLIAASIVPSNTVCAPGGYGWLNFFNYETGGYVNTTTVSQRYDSPIVGINVIYIEGKPIVEVVTANKPTPEIDPNVQIDDTKGGFKAKRVIWRELIQ